MISPSLDALLRSTTFEIESPKGNVINESLTFELFWDFKKKTQCHDLLKCVKDCADQCIDKKIAEIDAEDVSKLRSTLLHNTVTWGFIVNKGRPYGSQYSNGTGLHKVEESHLLEEYAEG